MTISTKDIQCAILSSFIFDGTLDKVYELRVKEYYFTYSAYRKIFESIVNLDKKGFPIDEEFIIRDIGDKYQAPLLEILSANPIVLSRHYIDILKNDYIKFKIQQNSLSTLKSIKDGKDVEEIKVNLHTFLENIEESSSNELFEGINYNPDLQSDMEFISEEFVPFPTRTASIVSAGGGTGKSWLLLQVGIREALKDKKVFMWLSEDPISETMKRANTIIKEVLINANEEKVKKNLLITASNTFHVINKKGDISPKFYELKKSLSKYDIIILDPLIGFYGSDENDNADARKFMQLFTQWASKENKTIIFIHHSTKGTSQSRGASAFVDAVRLVYELEKIKDDMVNRKIKLTKDNYNVINIIKSYEINRTLFPIKIIRI